MKNKYIFLLFGIILVIATGCPSPDGNGDGSDILNVFYGTITVPDSGYWDNIVLGIFSGGTGGTYPQLDWDTENSSSTIYRLFYSENDDGSDVEIPQVSGATSSIASSGATSRTYSFELPLTLPQEEEYYHVVCFYDDDLDGNIDLTDMDPWVDSGITALGEYNRFPAKDTTNVDDEPTTITIFYFIESQDMEGNPTGNYKYVGYDEDYYNEQMELDNENNQDIDFAITANTGW